MFWHHTAGNGDAWGDARYQCHVAAAKPVSNITIDENVCLILAAGATNTNGSGSNSPMRFSRGTIARDDANRRVIGVEICNNGVGEPYAERLIDAMFALSNTLNARCGNQPADVCTHQHYAPERKVDPSTANAVQGAWRPRSCNSAGSWNVEDLRAECQRRALAALEDDDMPLSDEDVERIARAVWSTPIDTSAREGIEPQAARRLLHRTFLIVSQYLGSFSGRPPPDETMLERIDKNTRA